MGLKRSVFYKLSILLLLFMINALLTLAIDAIYLHMIRHMVLKVDVYVVVYVVEDT